MRAANGYDSRRSNGAFATSYVMTQHAFSSAARVESAGKLLFGQPTDRAFFGDVSVLDQVHYMKPAKGSS